MGSGPFGLWVNGVRMDEIRRDKKYWFTPLDSLGPQGLSPEYSTSLDMESIDLFHTLKTN